MGKILMFKDADFSAVAVDHVPTGVTVLKPVINTGRAINGSGTVTNTEGWAVYYVPIVSGRLYDLSIVWSDAHFQRVGLSSSVPTTGSTLQPMIVNQQQGQATVTLDLKYTATSNGYLIWQMHTADTIKCLIKEWQYE